MDICVVCCRVTAKGKHQENQVKGPSMDKVQRQNKNNLGGVEIIRTRPDLTRDPPNLVSNVYRASFSGVKRPGRGVNHLLYLAPWLKKE
jgi:hypothetical protein